MKGVPQDEHIRFDGKCHDCQHDINIVVGHSDDGKSYNVFGGALYRVHNGKDEKTYLKCEECFEKDNLLRNYKVCEVYSRVTGYLRPVSYWNIGKKQEWGMRKKYNMEFTREENNSEHADGTGISGGPE